MIKRLKYEEVDWQKYQNCLESSEQKIYSAEKKYLDVTSGKNWEVLVLNDYEAVMPVTYVKKFGFKIVVNPKLTQQLGVFSKNDTREINERFLEFLQKKYTVWYYAFNEKNKFFTPLKKRKNFILESNVYEEIRGKYSPKRKRKLRLNTGVKEFSEINDRVEFEEAEKFIRKNMIGTKNIKETNKYLEVIKKFNELNMIDFHGFYYKNQLINLVAIYQEKYTSVLLGTYNMKDFVKLNGASNLIDFAIKKNVETKIFDFEGGDLPNMEEYFRGFRAEYKTYPIIKNSKWFIVKKAMKYS